MPRYGNKTIDSLPTKYKDAISYISDERGLGDGFWIYLAPPFFNPDLECRTIHEPTITEAVKELKRCVNHPITEEEYFTRQRERTKQ